MAIVLLTLTIVSVIAALGFGWFAWRLREEERRRSEARVTALSIAIDEGDEASDARAAHAPVAVNTLFSPEHSAAAKGGAVIKLAVGVAMAVVLLVAIAMNNRGATSDRPAETAAARPVSAQPPLELISMRHEREGNTLRVTGLVRNPRGARAIARVTAVVFAFNRAGAFVASGSAGLDFTTLDAGDESPFVVTIPGVTDVGRYRVSFRTEAGVMRHVDRRSEQIHVASAGVGFGRPVR